MNETATKAPTIKIGDLVQESGRPEVGGVAVYAVPEDTPQIVVYERIDRPGTYDAGRVGDGGLRGAYDAGWLVFNAGDDLGDYLARHQLAGHLTRSQVGDLIDAYGDRVKQGMETMHDLIYGREKAGLKPWESATIMVSPEGAEVCASIDGY